MIIRPLPENMAEIIGEIIQTVSRAVTAYTYTTEECSSCSLDPVTNLSTDAFCTECDGDYWIKTYTPTIISGYVFWGPADELNWQSGGKLLEGECRLQIVSGYLPTVEASDYLVVDERKMYVKDKKFRGVPTINRVLLTLEEKE